MRFTELALIALLTASCSAQTTVSGPFALESSSGGGTASTGSGSTSSSSSSGGGSASSSSSSSSSGSGTTSSGNPTVDGQPNVIPFYVNADGTHCGTSTVGYNNQECITVTICVPGTATCQVLSNVLLDTGSVGLRVLKTALNANMTLPLESAPGGGTLAECMAYLAGDSDWGPVATADIQLGAEPFAHSVPVQVIDATFSTPPSPCAPPQATLAETIADTGWDAILGTAASSPIEDCGSPCTSVANNQLYFSCNGTSCAGTTVPLASQTTNPVAMMPVDNNGLAITLPAVGQGGEESVEGTVTFGIGTRANNHPAAGVTALPLNVSIGGMPIFVNTQLDYFSSTPIFGFLDSGSSSYVIPQSGTAPPPLCSDDTSCFCNANDTPYAGANYVADLDGSSSEQNDGDYTYVISGSEGTPVAFTLEIGNMDSTAGTASTAFSDVACSNGINVNFDGLSAFADLGLPFFFGKTVYTAFENQSTPLGTGPFWAY